MLLNEKPNSSTNALNSLYKNLLQMAHTMCREYV